MKDPGTMTNSAINRRLDALSKQISKVTDQFIATGRGHERPSDFRGKTDPLTNKWRVLTDEYSALRGEVDRRYGPGAPSRLPRQTRSRRRNPAPFSTLESDINNAREMVAKARRDWHEMERQARTYYDNDEIMFSASFRRAHKMADEKLAKAERALKLLYRKKRPPAKPKRSDEMFSKKKRTTRKKNPAYGNYSKARAVARGSRRVNPVTPIRPPQKRLYVIASADPKARPLGSKIQWWTGAGWANSYRHAAEFTKTEYAVYAAKNFCKRKCAVVLYGTQDQPVAAALRMK